MSVSTMTDIAFARRADVGDPSTGPANLDQVATSAGQPAATASTGTTALAAIAAYIPTEIVTVYVAVLAAVGITVSDASSTVSGAVAIAPVAPYVGFIVLTPIVVWGLYAVKVVTAGKRLPRSFKAWPKWEMIAATISFAVWGAALPASPLLTFSWFNVAVGGVAVLIVSMLLGVFSPLFTRKSLANN